MDLARIHGRARYHKSKWRGGLLQLGDFENEAVLAALSGQDYYIDGPMLNLMRRQPLLGQHRVDRPHAIAVRTGLTDRSKFTQSHEDLIVARVTVERLLGQLTPFQRQAVTLNHIDGMSGTEVADTLGVPISTAYARCRDAMTALRGMVRM